MRIHGRGGQGVVTAAELLSVAAFAEGRYAQAFPTFGSERTGAPVVSFCRIDYREIRLREPITEPDAVIVQDPTLLHQVDLFAGLGAEGYLLLNTGRSLSELGIDDFVQLEREHPGVKDVLLGAFAALSGIVSLESVSAAIRDKFPGELGERNVRAAEAAHRFVLEEKGAVSVA